MRGLLLTGPLSLLLFSQTLFAQDLFGSITSLTASIDAFKAVLTQTNTDIEAKFPEVQVSLNKAADSLQTIGNFTVTLQQNQNTIIAASVGALAGGIAIGILSATFLFSCNPKHNLFYRGYQAVKAWRAAQPALESITI